MSNKKERAEQEGRRDFLKGVVLGSAALGSGLVTPGLVIGESGKAMAAQDERVKMAFVQIQPHTVSSAWSVGLEEVLSTQQTIDYQQLDGQNKVEVQVSLMDTLINEGAKVIFLQPIDSVALGPSIKKARRRGIAVITLNIDASEEHAAHVEMNHYYGAMDIAKEMGKRMGGKGKVAILNAPPGIIIRDQRTNGFVDGMKKYYPDIQIAADQVADWSRKKAQDVLSNILTAQPDITGVYGVNDSMALGGVDVCKQKGILDKMVIFGNDGETAALESIERGELTGTQFTDVYQQGRFAAAAASVFVSGGVTAKEFKQQGKLLMPYVIATSETVGSIQPAQRW
ncbi:sugar ABC transporter substrate-binding protein [Cohaesibacter haloalkalitolerans]|uniref:sugar ABC transporter substrate-binding protein n=1 Tax=Cohaesibacter haloalkalitolerans TaxID=1162980 RepID=UPI000E652E61|nr:sugar ABC transporter substrate-binding protein [Cohaesibacter haloalkalitolerans]